MRKWDAVTYRAWCTLLEGQDDAEIRREGKESMEQKEKRTGLGFRPSVNFWGEENEETRNGGEGIWWREGVVRDFEVLTHDQFPVKRILEGDEERGFVFGVGYRSICFDPPVYLAYLFERIKVLGATVIKSHLDIENGLDGIVTSAKNLLQEKGLQEMNLFINCTGLSARHFLPTEEAGKLFPIRGQTLLMKGEAKRACTITNIHHISSEEILYVIPRPGSGTTIFGGCKQVGSFDTEIDAALIERILARMGEWKVAEECRGEDGDFEVLSEQVGFRPGRRGGPRVEVEGRAGGVLVVHSYGHSGSGYQNSVGCAEEVKGLIEGLFGGG